MLKNFRLIKTLFRLVVILLGLGGSGSVFGGPCVGSSPNPISDICWACIFPINIAGVPIDAFGTNDNYDSGPPTICVCPAPYPQYVRFGVGVTFWEPARVAEVVRTPNCSPTFGGTTLGSSNAPEGTHDESEYENGMAFYQVHWYVYPILSWVGSSLTETLCSVSDTFDVAWFSELDPLWDDDELAFLINPEAVLFANPVTQLACAADTIRAAAGAFGIDSLFWCSGSTGSVFPLSGTHANHNGAVDSSLATVHKHVYKMHRYFLAHDTSTTSAICGSIPQPVMRKNQYKQSMMYPIPQTDDAYGFGAPSMIWGAGREFPYRGEDFSYLVWRKRMCCVSN